MGKANERRHLALSFDLWSDSAIRATASSMGMAFAATWLLALAALAGFARCGHAVALCDNTGLPKPTARTFMAAKDDTVYTGWIMNPSCVYETVSYTRLRDGIALLMYSKAVEQVISAPAGIDQITFEDSPLSQGADFSSATKLQTLMLTRFSPALLDNLILPKSIRTVYLSDTAFTSIDNVLFPEGLRSLIIGPSTLRSLDKVVFPASLEYLDITDTTLASIDNAKFPDRMLKLLLDAPLLSVDKVKFPASLLTLFLQSKSITSLSDVTFPATLKYLYLDTNSRRLDFTFPATLDTFQVANSPLPVLERVSFPDSIAYLDLLSCNTTVVKGVAWPSKLTELSIGPNPISSFEIRQSDVRFFESLSSSSTMTLSQTVCADTTANLTVVNKIFKWKMCVISDERFDELYGVQPSEPPSATPPADDDSGSSGEEDSPDETSKPSKPPILGEASGSGSTDLVDDDTIVFPGAGKLTRKPSTRKPGSSSNVLPTQGLDLSDEGFTNTNSSRPSRRTNSTGAKSSTKSNTPSSDDETEEVVEVQTLVGKTMVVAAVVAGSILALIVLCFGARRIVVAFRGREKSNDGYATLASPTADNWGSSSNADHATTSVVAGVGAVCNDKLLLPFRIKQSDVVLQKTESSQGCYDMVHGIYKGRDVNIKRIQPAFSSDEHIMASFDEEIRMCAGLDHPKIVAFVGITWSHPRDLSAIVEFMAGGDLETLLHSQQEPPIACDWSAPWTTSQIKSKLSIALDVAEAVVYLHASKTPITHRDLRARNVLLDNEGNAKLDAFAINRSAPGDETMKDGVESVAWMAPEVLMGEAFTEKTDVYAFGVLLVELDRCRHPFPASLALDTDDASGSISAEHTAGSSVSQKNIQIAVQVCAGQLRPTASADCPEQITALVDKCLSFDGVNRPSAHHVFAELCQIRDLLDE